MQRHHVAMSNPISAILIWLFVIAILLAGWIGYEIARHRFANMPFALSQPLAEETVIAQSTLPETRPTQDTAEFELMVKHLGRIESDLIRINALGAHLVEYAQLSPEEFRFDMPAPMGGPYEPLTSDHLLTRIRLFEEIFRLRLQQFTTLKSIIQFQKQNHELTFDKKAFPVPKGWISSYFGTRTDPLNGNHAWHGGVDIAAPEGTPVKALASGIVTQSSIQGAYGNLVEINHGNGLVSRYAHNQKRLVETGTLVKKGQTIALLGSTGRSTGPHLHLEVHEHGRAVDPGAYFPNLKKST